MAVTDVEITISAARDLKNVNWKHGDLRAYAVAWINDGSPPVKVTTRVDASGDTRPSWSQKFTLSVSKDRLEDAQLILEIYHDNADVDPKKAIVGRASLDLLEVMDAGGYDEAQDYVLKLKRPSGRPHGKADIAVRLREKRGAYGQSYNYKEGGQGSRDWQSAYPGYSSPYPPAQPYHQNYPSQPYPGSYNPYPENQPYGAAPPPPTAYGSYDRNPSYGGNTSYGAPPPQPYTAPSPDYYNPPAPAQKTSKFGGIGTGLAVGALAGAVGGLALGEYVDHEEDKAAREQFEEDSTAFGEGRDDNYRDDNYRDDNYGDDNYGDDF